MSAITEVLEWSLEKVITWLMASSEFEHCKPSKSPKFTIKDGKFQSVWRMEIKYARPNIEISLCLFKTATTNYFLNNFVISLKSQDNLTWTSFKKKALFSMEFQQKYRISCFMNQSALRYLYQQKHSFTITCKMDLQLIECKINSIPVSVPDFENLMCESEFSDLILVASGKEFKVHKNILATKSKTFYNIIKHKTENVLVIEDFNDEVINELIRYIYCGRVENLAKLSEKLMEAAEKYDIEGLKLICLEEFCRNMTNSNCCQLLFLLDQYKFDNLKSQVLNFIVYHLRHISKADFLAIKSSNLMREIFFKTLEVYELYDS